MVDNFDRIKPLLDFYEKGTFYIVLILKRLKDSSDEELSTFRIDEENKFEGGAINYNTIRRKYHLGIDPSIRNIYIRNPQDLLDYKADIQRICEETNSRAHIFLNKRVDHDIAHKVIQYAAEIARRGDHKDMEHVYSVTCETSHSEKPQNEKWLIDIDEADLVNKNDIIQTINNIYALDPKTKKKVIAEIPSKTGIHLIVPPFDLVVLKETAYKHLDVHKNRSTILYVP